MKFNDIANNNNLTEGEKDACYRKVKSRYKVWPSAYASGALVQCRKVGAKNWGNKSKNESVDLKFNTVELIENQIASYAKKYFEAYNIDLPHGKFITNIKKFNSSKIIESLESNEITEFIQKINSLDTNKTIKVGDFFSVLEFDINFGWREINVRGFINPKEVARIRMHSNGTINYIEFTDGDRYPRLTQATYQGKPVIQSAYFDDRASAEKALILLTLQKPNDWELNINDLENNIEEDFNGEYDDEAGMAETNLHTIARAAQGLLDAIDDRENLPEWVQEKIAKVEGMLVSAWDYLESQEEQGIDPRVDESAGSVHLSQKLSYLLEGNASGDNSLHDWFTKSKSSDGTPGWVQIGGKYAGKPCAKQPGQKTKPKCGSSKMKRNMNKKEEEAAARRKRREDPNPNRKGKAKNVATKSKRKTKESIEETWEQIVEACWKGYHKEGMKTMFGKKYPNCVKNKKGK